VTAGVSARIAADGLSARVVNVGSLFQVFAGDGAAAFAPGAGQPSELYLRMLLQGFLLAPRGMGAIPSVATEADVDDLVDAIGRVLETLERTTPVAVA
jgi:glutamate-1-semialdehyde aminotransferase